MARFTSLAYTYNNMILAVGVESGGGVVKEVKGKENYEKVKKLWEKINILKLHKIPWGKLHQIISFRGFYNTPAIVGGTGNGVIKVDFIE